MSNQSSDIDLREVELKADGARLHALIGMPSDPAGWVIVAHEAGCGLHGSALASVARSLNRAGLATLSMELQPPAESARRTKLDAPALGQRLMAGTEWLRSETGETWGAMGAGEGAAAALWAAADPGSGVSSVVACAPRLEGVVDRLHEIEARALLIVGGADRRALKQVRWARRRLANSEMIVVPGATRLFDAPAALRVLSERSVEWFRKALIGDEEAMDVGRARLSRESRRRLAAVASLFLMTGWALAPKAGAATAFFDATGNLATVGTQAGQLGIAYASADTSIVVGADGTGHVTVMSGATAVPIKDATGGTGNTVTPLAPAISRIVVNASGFTGAGGVTGARLYDLSGVTPDVFTGLPTVVGGTGLPNQTSEALFSVIVTDGGSAGNLVGSSFPDWFVGNNGADTAIGNDGADHLDGSGGADVLDGGDGDDYLKGNAANDFVVGGAGNDTLDGNSGVDTLDGGDGNDWFSLLSGDVTGASVELALGGPGDDTIAGSQQPSSVDGGSGVNMVLKPAEEWANADVTILLPAYMTISTNGADAGTITDQQPLDPESPYTLQFTNCQIPGMIGTGNIFDTGLASGANWRNLSDTLDMTGWTGLLGAILTDGNSGDDILIGTNGPDTLNITFGNDSVVGGNGTDLLHLDASPGAKYMIKDSSKQVPNTTARVAISPTITGAPSENIAYSFFATAGTANWSDTISSIEQFQLLGSDFNDTTGALGGDTLDISAVSLASVATVSGNDGPDLIIGSANGDLLVGNNQNDTINAGDGGDTIKGGPNNDALNGAGGDDLYIFANNFGQDAISDAAGQGNDTVTFSDSSGAALQGATLTLGSLNVADSAGNSLSGASAVIEDLVGTYGDDVFLVRPGSTAFNVDGSLGDDTLKYNAAGLTDPVQTTTGADAGRFEASGVETVTYSRMESAEIVGLISSARTWQLFE